MMSDIAKSTSVNITAFSCTNEKKMHHFTLFLMAAGSQNGDFQTFLDFAKTNFKKRFRNF